VFGHRNFFWPIQEWQPLVISWFWSNLEKSLKVIVKAPCGYRGLLVQCLEKWHGEKEKLNIWLEQPCSKHTINT
jgi:hypothetical protein